MAVHKSVNLFEHGCSFTIVLRHATWQSVTRNSDLIERCGMASICSERSVPYIDQVSCSQTMPSGEFTQTLRVTGATDDVWP